MHALFLALATFRLALPAWAGEPVKLTNYFPPPESRGGWRTLLPESGSPNAEQKKKIRDVAGVDYDKLAEAWEHNLRAEGPSMLLVIRRGHIVGEWYNPKWLENGVSTRPPVSTARRRLTLARPLACFWMTARKANLRQEADTRHAGLQQGVAAGVAAAFRSSQG